MALDFRCAVLLVSVGSRFPDALQTGMTAMEREIAGVLPGVPVYWAFTGGDIPCAGVPARTVFQALTQLQAAGYCRVLLQPIYLAPGRELNQLRAQAAPFAAGLSLIVGEPLLTSPEDCRVLAQALAASWEEPEPGEVLVLVGHGSMCGSNQRFLWLEQALRAAGRRDTLVGVLRGEPGVDQVLSALRRRPYVKTVRLRPLFLTAGVHVRRDLAGPGGASWRTCLEAAGYDVRCTLRGLGEYPAVCRLFALRALSAGARAQFPCAMPDGICSEDPDGAAIQSIPNREASL